MGDASASSDEDDPVVSVALRKRRRALAVAAVQRDEPEEHEARGEDGEDESGAESGEDDVRAEGAHPPERVAQMRRVVESIELCVRNVGLSPDYIALADPELAKLQATCRVHAKQAVSDRWSEPFVSLLRRSRMIRVQTIPRVWKAVLRERAGRCQVCGAREHRCDQVFELVGVAPTERAARPLGAVPLGELAEAYNDYDDADDAIGAGRHGIDEYLGMFACGQTCFEKVVTAFMAQNFVMDIAYGVRHRIDEALAFDPALLARWEHDERDPRALVEPITTRDTVFAEQLLTKLQRIEATLRGASLGPAAALRQTGNAATWDRIDATLLREAGADEDTPEEEGREDVLRACARHARVALTAFGYEEVEEDTASESGEGESSDGADAEEAADDEVVVLSDESDAEHAERNGDEGDEGATHPPPPPPSPVRRDPVSARTRGALARLGGVAR